MRARAGDGGGLLWTAALRTLQHEWLAPSRVLTRPPHTFHCVPNHLAPQIKYIADPSMHSMPSMQLSPNAGSILCQSLDNQVRPLDYRRGGGGGGLAGVLGPVAGMHSGMRVQMLLAPLALLTLAAHSASPSHHHY